MDQYYVNKQAQANGDHEVHKSGCSYMPSKENQQYLGLFDNCFDAVREAKKYYLQSNGCYYCSREGAKGTLFKFFTLPFYKG